MTPLAQLLEAALFAANHPLTISDLRALEPGLKAPALQEALDELRTHYDEGGHAFTVTEIGEGVQLLTRPAFAEAIARARIQSRPRRLSAAALETLAIIAYRQPVGRAEIEEIRGVAADGVLKSLQERDLIDVVGRGEGLGRPLLFGTTSRFLEMLGLNDVQDLPRLDQLSVALRPLAEPVFPGLDDDDEDEEVDGPTREDALAAADRPAATDPDVTASSIPDDA